MNQPLAKVKQVLRAVKQANTTKIMGYVLIAPALLSVILFVFDLITPNTGLRILYNLDHVWSGWPGYNSFTYDTKKAYAYTSALPVYFGLMAIAGAYLIKDKSSD